MTRVAVGIVTSNEKVLVCQRKKGARYGLKWEFPGGKLEHGETVEQCLKRELWEELSIQVQSIGGIEIQSATYDDGGTFEVAYCSVTSYDGELRNNVFEQFKWVTVEELRTMDILEGNKEFVGKMRKL
ncbi:MAG: (deoxy)nucleoside triphosphate pyrophosphohydrolase [Bacteroidota bacterium]